MRIFFKHQISYLLFLLSLFCLPLILFFQFSTYELPKIQYVFLLGLLISQYAFYSEKEFRKKIEGSVTQILKRELSRVPSRKEIYERSTHVVRYRGVCIIVAALVILFTMLYFKQF